MAIKTQVEGNRITMDDAVYLAKPAGTNQFAVSNEFGDRLGYFTVRGRAVEAEDYGVDGAHPIMQIGKLWVSGNVAKLDEKPKRPATKGVCRVATHAAPTEADMDKARAYRAWMKKQPGCKASYFVHDPATGKALSISIWEKGEQLAALAGGVSPDGGVALAATSVELFAMVEEP